MAWCRFADDTPLAAIEALGPDVLIKGADYAADSGRRGQS